jgi:hypothetical protein
MASATTALPPPVTRTGRRWLVLLLALTALSPWLYWTRVVVPFAKRDAPARLTSNFYPLWMGTRAALLEHRDPYSVQVTRDIQIGYYGVPNDPAHPRDEERFAYPAHLILLLVPFALLPFKWANGLFTLLLVIATVSSVIWWLQALLIRGNTRLSKLMYILAALGSWCITYNIVAQQISALIVAGLAYSAFCATRGRYWQAGLALSLTTIKPQLSLLFIVWLCSWSLIRRERRPLFFSFSGSTAVLLFVSELLLPGWPLRWISGLHAYLAYTHAKLPLQILTTDATGRGLTIALLLLTLIRLAVIELRMDNSRSFSFSLALVTAVTALVVPGWIWSTYNQAILLPAAIYICSCTHNLQFRQRFAFSILLVMIFWSHFAAFSIATASFISHSIAQSNLAVALPVLPFAIVGPAVTLYLHIFGARSATCCVCLPSVTGDTTRPCTLVSTIE